jgi:hypothetical protein
MLIAFDVFDVHIHAPTDALSVVTHGVKHTRASHRASQHYALMHNPPTY